MSIDFTNYIIFNRKTPKTHYAREKRIFTLPVGEHVVHVAWENIEISNRILEPGFHACIFRISKKICGQKKLKEAPILSIFYHFYELELHTCIFGIGKNKITPRNLTTQTSWALPG